MTLPRAAADGARAFRAATPPEGPHAPERTAWTARLGPLALHGQIWYRLLLTGASLLPPWGRGAAIEALAGAAYLFLGRIRAAVAANLEPVLGRCTRREAAGRAWRTIRAFTWCFGERLERLAGRGGDRFRFENREAWSRALRSGRGVILATGHVGNWESAAPLAAAGGSGSVHLVREAEPDRRTQTLLARALERGAGGGVRVRYAGEPGLGVSLLAALRRGEVVAVQADRPPAAGRTIVARLFGRPFPLPEGPLALARASGAPLLPVFSFREGDRRYCVSFRSPIAVADTPDRAADVAAAAARLAREIEWAILRAPHQWFCPRRVWESAG